MSINDEKELARAHWRLDEVDVKLRTGAESFAKVNARIDAVQPKPINSWAVAAKVFGVVFVVAGIAFGAGNYPTRGEWEKQKENCKKQIDSLESQVNQLMLTQRDTNSALTALMGNKQIEQIQKDIKERLDALAQPEERPRKGR